MIISSEATHMNTVLLQVFKEASDHATIVTELPPFTASRWSRASKAGP